LLASYFETGWDSWADGGSDATRVFSSSYSWEGNYSIRLADNSGTQSAMTSPSFNLLNATGLQIEFYFYSNSMEVGEDFWVRYHNGVTWTTIATFIRGTHFNNNTFYVTTVTVPNFTPTMAGTLRIQCDASDNNDQIYVDQVTITKLTGSSLPEAYVVLEEAGGKEFAPQLSLPDAGQELHVYPNPVHDVLNIQYGREISSIRMVSMQGRDIDVSEEAIRSKQINIQSLAPGIYILYIQSEGEWYPVRFSKF
jgi:hypothetical protein